MRHIKVIVPKFHEYPLIISRCFLVIYILIRNGLLTEMESLNIINKKYQKVLNAIKFIFEKKKSIVNFSII